MMKVTCGVVMALLVLGAAPHAQKDLVDLKRIGHIESKGRVQDNRTPVVEALIRAGPAAVSFLVSKIEDKSPIPGFGVLDFWPRVEVGTVALIVLLDLFTLEDGTASTVPGLNWTGILDGSKSEAPSWEIYGDFVEKRGRSEIRKRVEQLLAPHKDKLVWDARERCFRPREADLTSEAHEQDSRQVDVDRTSWNQWVQRVF